MGCPILPPSRGEKKWRETRDFSRFSSSNPCEEGGCPSVENAKKVNEGREGGGCIDCLGREKTSTFARERVCVRPGYQEGRSAKQKGVSTHELARSSRHTASALAFAALALAAEKSSSSDLPTRLDRRIWGAIQAKAQPFACASHL